MPGLTFEDKFFDDLFPGEQIWANCCSTTSHAATGIETRFGVFVSEKLPVSIYRYEYRYVIWFKKFESSRRR
jgi:hypothetical protein